MATDEVPDLYTDTVQVGVGPFGILLAFAMAPAGAGQLGGGQPIKVCNLRMSIEHAKILSIILRKNIKTFEGQLGSDIPIHPQVLQQLGLSIREDW
jgi:hypothetical protein